MEEIGSSPSTGPEAGSKYCLFFCFKKAHVWDMECDATVVARSELSAVSFFSVLEVGM